LARGRIAVLSLFATVNAIVRRVRLCAHYDGPAHFPPKKCPFPWRSGPPILHLIHGSLDTHELAPNGISIAKCDICCNRPHLCTAWAYMRHNNL